MPIHCPISLAPLPDAEFDAIDRVVMACCYAAQNQLGRLCDERVYENDVAARLRGEGFTDVKTQIPVTLTHQSFSKTYRFDLVVGRMLYEFKTVSALAPEHDMQGIHYAVLGSTDRVKLVNFRPPKVVGRLLRSPLWRVDRSKIVVHQERWRPLTDACATLVGRTKSLLGDWGAFLEARLYEEAMVHFFGDEAHGERCLPVVRDGLELGTHRLPCHAVDVGFVVTALSKEAVAYEAQLQRLLRCLPLEGIQWLNLKHAELQLVTLRKGKEMKPISSSTHSSAFIPLPPTMVAQSCSVEQGIGSNGMSREDSNPVFSSENCSSASIPVPSFWTHLHLRSPMSVPSPSVISRPSAHSPSTSPNSPANASSPRGLTRARGDTTPIGEFTEKKRHAFEPPGEGDWILVLDDTARKPLEPDNKLHKP